MKKLITLIMTSLPLISFAKDKKQIKDADSLKMEIESIYQDKVDVEEVTIFESDKGSQDFGI